MLMWFLFKRTLLAAAGMRSEHCGLSRHAAAIGAFREDSPICPRTKPALSKSVTFPFVGQPQAVWEVLHGAEASPGLRARASQGRERPVGYDSSTESGFTRPVDPSRMLCTSPQRPSFCYMSRLSGRWDFEVLTATQKTVGNVDSSFSPPKPMFKTCKTFG